MSALEAEYAASQQQVREREHEITLRQRELARVRASINNKDNFKVVLDNRIKELEEREGGWSDRSEAGVIVRKLKRGSTTVTENMTWNDWDDTWREMMSRVLVINDRCGGLQQRKGKRDD